MATTRKRSRVEVSESKLSTNAFNPSNLSDAHDFLAPHEICTSALGLLHCLTTKHLINMSFSALYHKSSKDNWNDIFTRERRSLKANVNSVEKCFLLNRLLAEYTKDPNIFNRRVECLYDEIRQRMSHFVPSPYNYNDLYREVQDWRSLQCKRRLFYINHDAAGQLHSLLSLQQVATHLFSHLLKCTSARSYLIELLHHSFIIVAQPTGPDCVAATKYEKIEQTYTARLHTRIICLLNPDVIKDHVELSNIGVTLHLLHDLPHKEGEIQPELQWRRQEIIGAEGPLRSFLYAELSSLQLSKLDSHSNLPIYNTNLCRLQFRIKIKILEPVIKEELKFESQPFGLCSHAQYFPELVARAIIFEIEQMMPNPGFVILPDKLTNYICCYYVRVTGIDPQPRTCRFILSVLQAVHDTKNQTSRVSSIDIYREIFAKLISQIGFFADHPCMSMMYHDGLFLGVSDNRVDDELNGSRERPHICIRFNSLQDHRPTQLTTIRYIVHDGQLTKANFQMRVFSDEMSRFVYEATQKRAGQARLLCDIPNQTFKGYSVYFHDELFRLSALEPHDKKAYKPLIPVLWNTMKNDSDDQREQAVPAAGAPLSACEARVSTSSSINQTETNSSASRATVDSLKSSDELKKRSETGDSTTRQEGCVVIDIDSFAQLVTDKLSQLFSNEARNGNTFPPLLQIIKSAAISAAETDLNTSHRERSPSMHIAPSLQCESREVLSSHSTFNHHSSLQSQVKTSIDSLKTSSQQQAATENFTFNADPPVNMNQPFSAICQCLKETPTDFGNDLAGRAASLLCGPDSQSNELLPDRNTNLWSQLPSSSYLSPLNSTQTQMQTSSHVPKTESEWLQYLHDEFTSAEVQSMRTERITNRSDSSD